jgi:predicted DNA-binding protein (MmcQ/YjbR family)
MNLKAIQKFCANLPHATHDVKWEIDYVYSIGGKMFAIACENKHRGVFVSFKVDDDRFLEFTDRAGFIPAPYLARMKWVQINDLRRVGDAELKSLLKHSYDIVARKLTKKMRREFGMAE